MYTWLAKYFCLFALAACTGRNMMEMEISTSSCSDDDDINANHPKAGTLRQHLDEIVVDGIPGAVLAIYDRDGYWAAGSGLAKIETNTSMQVCHLQYGQSIAKTYMATAVLLLYEQGKLKLDQEITAYLSPSVASKITNAKDITIRMLLNHTSGIAEYNDKPNYVTYLLQHPLHSFSPMDYLDFSSQADPKFAPGDKYSYTNTNYLVLALLVDEITDDHKKFIREEIFFRHELHNTFYHDSGFLERPELVNSYWDRYSNGEIENVSEMQKTNVASMIGDDGIIATPIDFINFLKKLLENEILSDSTMKEMLDFVQKNPGDPDGYGLGIHKEYYNGRAEIGHTGGGIGSGCMLGYFPDSETYYFIGINMGTSIYSPNFDQLEDKIHGLFDILLE